MKKIPFTFLFILAVCTTLVSYGQGLQPGECGLLFTYDATGSLIKREYICNNTGEVMDRKGKNSTSKNDSVASKQTNVDKEEIIRVNAIMPNPTSGRFTVTLSKPLNNADVLLLNANGSIIERKRKSGSILSFDLSNRASGTYYVRIKADGKATTFKVIKQ